MNQLLQDIGRIGVVPVIKIDDAARAVPLADALAAGGLPCAEITFRTAQGADAIARIAAERPNILVGAGTVLSAEQVDRAIDAGARFIVSPGLNPKTVEHCQKRGIPVLPGCVTPSEIERALELGLDTVKFFPAEQAGGLSYIKAVSAPYAMMRFMPTGGISLKNLPDYLSCKAVLACGGSYMVSADMINGERWDEISALCRQTVELVEKARNPQ